MIPRMPGTTYFAFLALLTCLPAVVTVAEVTPPVIKPGEDALLRLEPPAPGIVVRYNLENRPPVMSDGVWLAPVELPAGYTLTARAFHPDTDEESDAITVVGTPPGTQPRRASTLVPVTQNRNWRLYDWPARHAACADLMRTRQPEIVMLGDSITHFWGGDPVADRQSGPDSWDALFAGHRVVNLGFGWDRTENVLWRLTHGEFDETTPKVVVVLIGTNNITLNSPAEISAGIKAICDEIHRRSPPTRILLLGIFPRGEDPGHEARAKVEQVNALIAALDERDYLTYLDIGNRFLERDGRIARETMADFLHPTAKGYRIWAEAIRLPLQQLLRD